MAFATVARQIMIDNEEAFEILDGEKPFIYTTQTEQTSAAIAQIMPASVEFQGFVVVPDRGCGFSYKFRTLFRTLRLDLLHF